MTDRFRSNYKQLSEVEQKRIVEIKELASKLCTVYEEIPPNRMVSLAITNLEQSVMWAVKGVTE